MTGRRGPTLKNLLLALLSVRPTSVPSERVFSSAGQVKTRFRTRLTDLRFNNILFLKINGIE